MSRQNANTNLLYKLHPLQWSVVALLILNIVALFAPSGDEATTDEPLIDVGDLVLITDSDYTVDEIADSPSVKVLPPHVGDNTLVQSLAIQNNLVPHTQSQPEFVSHSQIDIAPVVEERLVCYEIGPIISEEVESFFQKALMPKGMALETNVVKHQEPIGYWVFMPPLRSKALGRLKVEEIKLKGVKDVVLLTKNKPRYAISLGIFKEEKFAKQRLLKIQSIGFDAKMEVRYKSLDEKWMFIEVAEKDNISIEEWDALIANHQAIEFRPQDCK